MSNISKTARASMMQTIGEKVVISDEVYVKNLRNDVASGLYVAEGAKALFRAYDALLTHSVNMEQQVTNLLGEKQAALNLLNEHLSGRKEEGGYKDLDDAIRQLLQAYIVTRDLNRELVNNA